MAVTRRRLLIASFALVGVGILSVSMFVGRRALVKSGDAPLFQLDSDPRFEWRSVDKKHWQVVAHGAVERPGETDVREGTNTGCAPGMVRVRGKHLVGSNGSDANDEVESLQNETCTNWISKEFPARCQTFDRDRWLEASQKLPRKEMDLCIDRFEYPNVKGENPIIVATYTEGAALCKKHGKRLCNESEWTFACEGEEAMPYPYGYERDPEACVVDRTWKPFSADGLSQRDGDKARAELDRLWQGEPSGTRAKCRSPFGVYDTTGNVDEWTKTIRTEGYSSVLKGGYWGPVRARCRPATRAHNEVFVAYQQSFRCCDEVPEGAPLPPDTVPVPIAPLAVLGDAGADASTTGEPISGAIPIPVREHGDENEALAKKEGEKAGCGGTVSPRRPDGAAIVASVGAFVAWLERRRRSRRDPDRGA